MCTDETNESSNDVPSDLNEERSAGVPSDPAETPPEPAAGPAPGPRLNRRRFLTAAALGTAAAALLNKGSGGSLHLGPAAALADNLSGLNCTANDVRIVGPGIILNEPCPCTGTFNAQVRFRVINNTGTTRYCVTVHFCPGALPGGGTFNPGDVLIGDIPKKSDAFYTVTIPNYPCGAGLVCFGACGPGTDPDTGLPDCSFPKGTACPAGQCCTTISWDVNPGCPTNVISSKCRHQQVCIQGRGSATLDCDTATAGVQTNCAVQCGSSTTLRLCTTSAASFGPFTFTLNGQSFGPTSDTCHDFMVGPITANTTFTGTVTDATGCASSASVTLTTTAVPTPQLSGTLNAGCTGSATFTVANCDPTLTYTFQEVDCTTGTSIGSPQGGLGVCSATFTFAPGATDTTHCVRVTASNGSAACDQSAQASVVIPAVVTATLEVQGTPGCDGVVTLLATAGGGVPPYTFQFNGATGTVSGSGNTRTITIQPVLDGSCRSVTVTVTDSRGCSATSNTVSFSSCVTTTFNC